MKTITLLKATLESLYQIQESGGLNIYAQELLRIEIICIREHLFELEQSEPEVEGAPV